MTTPYAPFRGSFRIIQGFTGSDYTRHHTGVDFGTPRSTQILASAAGTVIGSVDLSGRMATTSSRPTAVVCSPCTSTSKSAWSGLVSRSRRAADRAVGQYRQLLPDAAAEGEPAGGGVLRGDGDLGELGKAEELNELEKSVAAVCCGKPDRVGDPVEG
ncbi:hypothetical protein [Streptomyces sp. NPDC020951]|uniref:hypothetical protein n=1 Tax=Streptomyces sp. NPDC020951 TaxID=3365104 RepID=UPI0037AC41CE